MPQVPRNVITIHGTRLITCAIPHQYTHGDRVLVIAHFQGGQWTIKGVHLSGVGVTEVLLDSFPQVSIQASLIKTLRKHARLIKKDYTRFGVWLRADALIDESEYIVARESTRPHNRTPIEPADFSPHAFAENAYIHDDEDTTHNRRRRVQAFTNIPYTASTYSPTDYEQPTRDDG